MSLLGTVQRFTVAMATNTTAGGVSIPGQSHVRAVRRVGTAVADPATSRSSL